MREEIPVARSSLVPVLGCIALMLFGLNFYRFLDRQFFSKWKFCDHAARHEFVMLPHQNNAGVFVFEFDQQERQRDSERALRALRHNLERAERELARAQEQLSSGVHLERLQEDINVKTENMARLQMRLQALQERRDSACGLEEHQHADRRRFRLRVMR